MALLSRERYSEVDIIVCDATPEGDIAAPVGSMALSTEGVLYTKASGAGNTGWVKSPAGYYATLSQTGTDAPVATVLSNTLGGNPAYSYTGVGNYTMDLAGLVTAGAFIVQHNGCISAEDPTFMSTSISGTSVFIYVTQGTPPLVNDGAISSAPITIIPL